MSVAIFTEDRFGVDFFKGLLQKLKSTNIVKNVHYTVSRFVGKCNPKLNRQLKGLMLKKNIRKVIIVFDADGKDIESVKKEVEIHVPEEFKNNCNYLIFAQEIEELICFALGIRVRGKPSKCLDEYVRNKNPGRGYEKQKLPTFLPLLNINKLLEYPLFKAFIEYLADP